MTLLNGITDAMRQYEKSTEEVLKNKPKRSKEYGIKRPDVINIIAVIAGVFVVLVVASEFL